MRAHITARPHPGAQPHAAQRSAQGRVPTAVPTTSCSGDPPPLTQQGPPPTRRAPSQPPRPRPTPKAIPVPRAGRGDAAVAVRCHPSHPSHPSAGFARRRHPTASPKATRKRRRGHPTSPPPAPHPHRPPGWQRGGRTAHLAPVPAWPGAAPAEAGKGAGCCCVNLAPLPAALQLGSHLKRSRRPHPGSRTSQPRFPAQEIPRGAGTVGTAPQPSPPHRRGGTVQLPALPPPRGWAMGAGCSLPATARSRAATAGLGSVRRATACPRPPAHARPALHHSQPRLRQAHGCCCATIAAVPP